MKRIEKHPIVDYPEKDFVKIRVDEKEILVKKGEMIAAALIANGIDAFRETEKFKEPRGLFCGIGQCNDCVMEVNGIPNVRTCVTPIEEGMVIRTQKGLGKLGDIND